VAELEDAANVADVALEVHGCSCTLPGKVFLGAFVTRSRTPRNRRLASLHDSLPQTFSYDGV